MRGRRGVYGWSRGGVGLGLVRDLEEFMVFSREGSAVSEESFDFLVVFFVLFFWGYEN